MNHIREFGESLKNKISNMFADKLTQELKISIENHPFDDSEEVGIEIISDEILSDQINRNAVKRWEYG